MDKITLCIYACSDKLNKYSYFQVLINLKGRKIMKNLLLAILSFAFIGVNIAQETLPSVMIENLNGEKVDISKVAEEGKTVIISFWATWCKPCQKELNNIAEVYEDWQDDYNVEILAVSIDDARNAPKVKSYAAGQAWEYTILLDKNQDLQRALNFQTVPYVIVIDNKGNIVYKHSGYKDGDEEDLEEQIKSML